MNQIEALSHLLIELNSLRVPYMITGAYAVSYRTHFSIIVNFITTVKKMTPRLKNDSRL
jgi:hypothetical protein